MDEHLRDATKRQDAAARIATRIFGGTFYTVGALMAGLLPLLADFDLSRIVLGLGIMAWIGFAALPFIYFGGDLVGWAASKLVGDSSIPATRMSMVLAWTFIVSIFGWLILGCVQ